MKCALSSSVHGVGSREFAGRAAIVCIVGREGQGAGDDLREVGAVIELQQADGEVAVFGEAVGDVVRAGGALGVVARRPM